MKDMDVEKDRKYYWVAVNGASAALCGVPARRHEIGCRPRPSQLIGFGSFEEAHRGQQGMLQRPPEEAPRTMREDGAPKVWSGDMALIDCPSPEPPAAFTAWAFGRDAEEAPAL